MLKEAIRKLAAREHLTREEMHASLESLLRADVSSALAAAWLIALRMKGETPVEIAAAAEALRSRAERIQIRDPEAIDTCGTGGDGAETFNISTVAAFVVAGAGVTVAKHGNRAVSSRSGSADVLDALGVDLDAPVERVRTAIDEERIGFLFAQRHHPAMKHVGPVRRELGVRTVFNLAGPLSNPAGVQRQLVGVYSPELTELMAQTLGLLGARRAWVVHGADGLDELSLSAPTKISELKSGEVRTFQISPELAGLQPAPLASLKGGDARENATIALQILKSEPGPRRDAVLLNSAAALVVAEKAADLREGVALAGRSIDSGAALARLEGLLKTTGRSGGKA